jgi:hypothetical protein
MTNAEWIEILKIITWPVLIFIIIGRFDSELRGLINRIQSISAFGGTINAENKQQVVKNDKQLEGLANELKTQKDVQAKLNELQETTKRDRDWYMLHYHFEKNYRVIFGSQLEILDSLVNLGQQNFAFVFSIYSRTIWTKTYPFNQYIGFLSNALFIAHDPIKNTYSITLLGSLFLQYLRSNNIQIVGKQPY